ncbi:MAG: LptF/LptG family permease [Armatimonadota bacterium]|nr:LptF/LptG family permease [Armatimonadota bacterium]MDR5702739.1 LptF/LptG family permease [Armatimonadota bacterium]
MNAYRAMRLLDRYLLKELGGALLFAAGIFTSLLLANHLFQLARLIFQQGAQASVAIQLVLYRLPLLLTYSLPMSVLLATLLAFGRLSDRNEIAALRTSGISLYRLAVPVLAIGAFMSLSTFLITEGVVPGAEDRYRLIFFRELLKQEPRPQENVLFREEIDGIESMVFARRFHPETEMMEGVVVTQFREGRVFRVIEAAKAIYRKGQWEFERGILYLLNASGTVRSQFARLRVNLPRSPEEVAIPAKDPSEMSVRELRLAIDVLRRSGQEFTRYLVEMHTKMATPVSAIVFAILAVPLGLRPHRSGPSIGLGLSIVVILLYYLLLSLSLSLGHGGRLPPFVAAWLPNMVMALIGGWLLYRMER